MSVSGLTNEITVNIYTNDTKLLSFYCILYTIQYILYIFIFMLLYKQKYNINNNSEVKPAIIMILPIFIQENTVVVS